MVKNDMGGGHMYALAMKAWHNRQTVCILSYIYTFSPDLCTFHAYSRAA